MSERDESRSLQVLREAASSGRLAHGILLHGDSLKILEAEAMSLASILLEPTAENSTSHPQNHPDLFHLRPGKRMRLINVGPTRELIRQIFQTAHQGGNKVAIIHEADRFNKESANAFLKSLEEPPGGTYLLLLTTALYDLLPTIRSRCFRFKVPGMERIQDEAWGRWMDDFLSWLAGLANFQARGKGAAGEAVFSLYGLLLRYEDIWKRLAAEALSIEKEKLLGNANKDEKEAMEARTLRGTSLQLLKEIELKMRDFARDSADSMDESALHRKLVQSVAVLEELPGLIRLNLKDIVGLEYFFLQSLRIWSQS